MKYFAYGSNLNIKHMQWRCPDAVPLGAYTLHGYKLVFRYYADIVPDSNKSIKGGIWDITKEHEEKLDRYEGFPDLYGKFYQNDIMFYRMCDEAREYALPSLGYLEGVLEGMENFGLSPIEDLTHNLGIEKIENKAREGDSLQNAMQLIADAMNLQI